MEQFQMPPQGGMAPQTGLVGSWNTNVLKEPRGMIRIIQMIFAILAFATTINFDTTTSFTVSCFNTTNSDIHYQRTTTYMVEYPFDFSDTGLNYLSTCGNDDITNRKLPMDFSSSAKFFVASGILAFLYTVGILYFYIGQSQKYETNQFFPLADMGGTSLLATFWFAGAIAWAFSVSDIKYYAGPRHLIQQLSNCNRTIGDFEYNCFPESPGKWSALYISLIFGFANFFLWGSSIWFVYKETIFHRRTFQPQPVFANVGGAPGNTVLPDQTGQTVDPSAVGYGDTQWTGQQSEADLRMNSVAHNPSYSHFPRQGFGQWRPQSRKTPTSNYE